VIIRDDDRRPRCNGRQLTVFNIDFSDELSGGDDATMNPVLKTREARKASHNRRFSGFSGFCKPAKRYLLAYNHFMMTFFPSTMYTPF